METQAVTAEALKGQLATITTDLGNLATKFKEADDARKAEFAKHGEVSEATGKKLDEHGTKMVELQEELKAVAKRLDDAEAMKQRPVNLGGDPEDSPAARFLKSDAYLSYQKRGGRNTDEVEVGSFKRFTTQEARAAAAKALLSTTNLNDALIQPFLAPQVGTVDRQVTIRDLIPTQPIGSPKLEYAEIIGFVEGAVAVSGITRTGNVATVTTGTAHGYDDGDRVRIAGATQTEYNRIAVIRNVTSTTFQYDVQGAPVTPATGTITAQRVGPGSSAAATVAEGAAKPESEFEVILRTLTAAKLAHWLPITRELAQDAPAFRAFIENQLLAELPYAEERQILYGDGTGSNMQGIMTHPNIQHYLWSEGETGDNRVDALVRARVRAEMARLPVTAVVVNPLDWADVVLAKGSDGHYIFGMNGNRAEDFVAMRVVRTPSIAAGEALVGGFGIGATIYDVEQAQMFITDSHDDYFIKNKLAILAEERLMMPIWRPEAFVAVSYDSAPA